MKILIVNDDGYRGVGLHALIHALKDQHDLTVAVPSQERSGNSNCITFLTPLSVDKVHIEALDFDVWTVDGTPADCTIMGLDQLCDGKPDVVISGINNGYNIADGILYSGTVAAALQGAIQGIPTFALSVNHCYQWFDDAAMLFAELLPKFMEREKGNAFFYNINFPDVPVEKIKGILKSTISHGRMVEHFEKRISPYGRPYYWHAYDLATEYDLCKEEGSDGFAVKNGYISITPLRVDYLDKDALETMSDYDDVFHDWKDGQ
ncbi:MAG: 5'/3'-nucleotidase SurE [Bacillota bacterium]|nr:5'/3'-nucleotidase SurE [Bacillota bacterium]